MTEIIIIINLFVLETLLSIDNAAVLAVMVKHLPVTERPKALKYGLIGAFVFRGICLVAASWLVEFEILKVLGGIYLLWLSIKHFFFNGEDNKVKGFARGFWMTVLAVEFMDIAFSIDNVFAAVAFTNNIYLIMIGVFIGIVSMRFIAQKFTTLLAKYPSLNNSAFIVIFLLGLKLILAGAFDLLDSNLSHAFNSHAFDILFSFFILFIFFYPILSKKLKHSKL